MSRTKIRILASKLKQLNLVKETGINIYDPTKLLAPIYALIYLDLEYVVMCFVHETVGSWRWWR